MDDMNCVRIAEEEIDRENCVYHFGEAIPLSSPICDVLQPHQMMAKTKLILYI